MLQADPAKVSKRACIRVWLWKNAFTLRTSGRLFLYLLYLYLSSFLSLSVCS